MGRVFEVGRRHVSVGHDNPELKQHVTEGGSAPFTRSEMKHVDVLIAKLENDVIALRGILNSNLHYLEQHGTES